MKKRQILSDDVNKIYLIKNKINNKVYVGQTWMKINLRYSKHVTDKTGSCRKLFNAMNRHGRSNFYIEVIASTKNQLNADYLEEYFIFKYKSVKNGYNIMHGGSSGKMAEETKKKLSQLAAGSGNSFWGKKHSEESKNKMSETTRSMVMGENNPFYGKTHSEETKKKISAFNKNRYVADKNHFFGKKHSVETKNKMRETKRNKKLAKQMQQFYQSTIYYNLEI